LRGPDNSSFQPLSVATAEGSGASALLTPAGGPAALAAQPQEFLLYDAFGHNMT